MSNYCTQNNGNCSTCSLVNYGRDCKNNPIRQRVVIDLPRELWRRVGILAAQTGQEKREITVEALETYLQGNKKED